MGLETPPGDKSEEEMLVAQPNELSQIAGLGVGRSGMEGHGGQREGSPGME